MKISTQFFISTVKFTSDSDLALNKRTARLGAIFCVLVSQVVRIRSMRPMAI